jgi:opacity protein-like surface antigen
MLITAVSTPASAQYAQKFEAFGSIGMLHYSNYAFWGAARNVDYGGGLGIRPYSERSTWMRGWGLEFNLSGAPAYSSIHTQTRYTANILYHFLSGRTQPYVLIGAGGYHEPGDSSPPRGSSYRSRNQFLANAGGGLRIFLNEHWSIRPEYRGVGLRDRDDFARGSVRVGYHF